MTTQLKNGSFQLVAMEMIRSNEQAIDKECGGYSLGLVKEDRRHKKMTGVESLGMIEDKASVENIQELAQQFVKTVNPLKVILFGSFAKGSYNADSDYDFYLVVDDNRNVAETTREAHRASINIKNRPVDIVVGTNSRFEKKRNASYSQMVEREVEEYGILLYNKNETVV